METIDKKFDDISSYGCTNDGIQNLLNNNLQLSIEIVTECLTWGDQYLAHEFENDKYRTVLLLITKLALHLLSNIKNLEVFERDHLYNIGLLNIKIMHTSYIYNKKKFTILYLREVNSIIGEKKYIVIDKDDFYDAVFRYRFQSNNFTEYLLEHIQNITDSSLIQIVCLWLDIVVYYQYIVQENFHDNLKYKCIIKQKYNVTINLRLRGSFLFYLTHIPYPHMDEDEKLPSICRQHIFSKMKDPKRWTSETIRCAMGNICLITKHYSKYFQDDEEYYQWLLSIIIRKRFRRALVSTWTNDETILIHTIIDYFVENIYKNQKMIVTLGTVIDKLHKLYKKVKYESTRTKNNICYLILVSTNETSYVSDKIILACFQYIKDLDKSSHWQELEQKQVNDLLQGLEKACHYDSIQDAIIRLNMIDILINLMEFYGNIICDIFALLCTKSDAQKILRNSYEFIYYIQYHESNINEHSLQILKQNIDFSDGTYSEKVWFIEPMRVKDESEFHEATVEKWDVFVRYDMVLSGRNIELGTCVKNLSKTVHYNIFNLNEVNDEMEKEKHILTCECMIACLTNDYNQHLSELILAYKNQVKIILIVIEDDQKYCPEEPFLKFILEKYSSSLIRVNNNELNPSLINEIEHIRTKHANELAHSFYTKDPNVQSVTCTYTAKDLYKVCKENDIDKVTEYLQNIDIKVLNERVENRSTSLHIASYNGHNEIVQLLIKAGASRTIRNRPYELTPYEEARTQSTKDLFRIKIDDKEQDRLCISNDFYIEWMTASRNPRKKRDYLQQKLNYLQTCKNHQTQNVYEKLIKHMYDYINTLPLPSHKKQILHQFFEEMKEKCDPTYIIRAYTSTTFFHKYYNAFIAQHGIDFFDPFTVDLDTNYRLVKAVLKTISIVMNSKEFNKYRYCGKTYRGVLMTEKDLYKYVVNSKIMNKSFLSTSKSKETAESFIIGWKPDNSIEVLDNKSVQYAALCTYIIKTSETALDIQTISEIESEDEVLILPFSIFKVNHVRRSLTKPVEIELEEVLN
ncbi:hypothetical protein I4U23_016310 [Adineta vaga]|nr:hypothetical protein I4U23_016310 [Adineta vaga]